MKKQVRYCIYRNIYRILLEISVRKTPIGNPRHTSQDNIKIYLAEISCVDEDLIQLAQDRVQQQIFFKQQWSLGSVDPGIFNIRATVSFANNFR
jgi:hypothetical protein